MATRYNNAGLLQGGNNSIGVLAANKNQITNSGAIVGGAVGFIGVKLTGEGNFVNNSGFIGGAKRGRPDERDRDNGVVNYGVSGGWSGPRFDSTASGGNLVVTDDGDTHCNNPLGWGTTRDPS